MGGIFKNTPHVDMDVFYTDKQMCFQKYPDTCGPGHNVAKLTLH